MAKHLFKLILLLAVNTSAWGRAATPAVAIGAEDDWAPYSSAVRGQAQGFSVDVVRAAFAAVGVDVRFEVLPYVRCMAQVKAGRLAACFNTFPNKKITAGYLLHAQPLFTTHSNVYALATSDAQQVRIADLEGRTVGVTRDYEYGAEFDQNANIVRSVVDKNEQGFRMLLSRRIEFMAAEQRMAETLFKRDPAAFGGRFKVAGTFPVASAFMVFSKSTADGPQRVAQFNQGLARIRDNGTYRAIEKRWFQ